MSFSAPKMQVPVKEKMTTIGKGGHRFWLYPASFKGIWLKRRQILAVVLIAFYFILPWTKFGGHQTVLIDIADRKFAFFGLVLWPQDLLIFWFFLVGSVILIFLITALWGRLWCGWACPQTVFLEHVFRKIEIWIEGDAPKRRKLDRGPWNLEKIRKKGLKFLIFAAISSHFANTALCYFVGTEQVLDMTLRPPASNWSWFVFMAFVNVLFFLNFAWFREQFCLIACPYGRFQSVLLDKDSLIVGYNYGRGEPRAVLRKNEERKAGSCIDCNRCVAVCPTGIDIRMGLQMECVNCTACMDACDEIMERTGQDPGLIGYTSQAALDGDRRKIVRFRTVAYLVIFCLLWMVGAYMLSHRQSVIIRLTRPAGQSFTLDSGEQRVTNLFQAKASNKTDHTITLRAVVPQGYELVSPLNPWVIEGQSTKTNQMFISKQRNAFSSTGKEKVIITFLDEDDQPAHQAAVTIMGPVP